MAVYPNLTEFLKTVMNSLIANYFKSERVKSLSEVELNEEMDDARFFENLLEQKVITEDFIEKFEESLVNDSDAWLVFTELLIGITPKEIADKYPYTIEEVRNIQKKLRRRFK